MLQKVQFIIMSILTVLNNRKVETKLLNILYLILLCSNVLRCCYISSLVLTSFRLKKGRVSYFRPDTIVTSFLHLMVLLFKVLLYHKLHQNDICSTNFSFCLFGDQTPNVFFVKTFLFPLLPFQKIREKQLSFSMHFIQAQW